MTSTTTVLSILADDTTPSRTLRRLPRAPSALAVVLSLWSDIGVLLGSQCLGRFDLALAQQRGDAGDVLLHVADARRVVELPRHELEAQVEQLLARFPQA